jgi:predicted permease
MAADLGFEPVGITSLSVALPTPDSAALARVPLTTQQIVDRIGALPGVRGVSASWYLPFSGAVNTDGFLVEGHAPPANAGAETQTIQMPVTPGFFDLMRIPLRYGRDFTNADRGNTLPVVIVDDAFAKRYWAGADAIGKRMRFSGDTTWRTIVGVAGSVRDEDAATDGRPHTYQPFDQAPAPRPTFAIRIVGDPASVLAGVRRLIGEIAPTAPISGVRPLTDALSQTLASRRLTEMLLAGFALVAALLTAVGIYGVMALYVAHRTREFGVRLAVGAQPSTIVQLVLREGVVLAITGVAIGTLAALFATRWLRGQLYEVSPTDASVFALIGLGLLAVAVLACVRPARVAAQTDALTALRSE